MLSPIFTRAHNHTVRIDLYLHSLILVYQVLGFIVDLAIDLENVGPTHTLVAPEEDVSLASFALCVFMLGEGLVGKGCVVAVGCVAGVWEEEFEDLKA